MRLCCRRTLLFSLLTGLAVPSSLVAQSGTIRGAVVAADNGERLGYTLVAELTTARERFTSDSGTFTLAGVPPGPVRLRFRHLGFTPREMTVDVAPAQTVTLRVELTRFALTLSTMHVVADRQCTQPGPPDRSVDSTLAAVFEQLQQNADRYRLLMREYPFTSTYEVTDAAVRPTGTIATIESRPATVESGTQWTYAPGQVVRDRGRIGAWVHIPTLDVFADERFVEAHCFWYGGLAPVDGDTLLRIDFRVADRIDDPDLNGAMFLDSRTYLIRRTRLMLSKLPQSLDHGDSAVIITRFDELLPGVPFITDILSTLHMKPNVYGSGRTRLLETDEERRRIGVEFRGRPPERAHLADVPPIVAPYAARPTRVPRLLGIFDAESGAPIDRVIVSDSITGKSGRTTETGTIRLDFLSQAGGVLTLEKAGYVTAIERLSAAPDDTLPLTVLMSPVHH